MTHPHLEPLEPRIQLSGLSLDDSFGHEGVVVDNGLNALPQCHVALASHGTIVVATSTCEIDTHAGTGFTLARYGADGKRDWTFGRHGIAEAIQNLAGLSILHDGKILALGNNNRQTTLFRYNANGTPDGTFARRGSVTIAGLVANTLLQLRDGRLLLASIPTTDMHTWHSPTWTVLCLNADGSIDHSFGNEGFATINLSGARSQPLTTDSIAEPTLSVCRDGSILLSGSVLLAPRYIPYAFSAVPAVGRLSPDGKTSSVEYLNASGYDVNLILPDARSGLFIAGSSPGKSAGRVYWDGRILPAVAHFNRDGLPDKHFGKDGWAAAPIHGNPPIPPDTWQFTPLQRLSDGSLAVFGIHETYQPIDTLIGAIVHPDGSYDTRNSSDGVRFFNLPKKDMIVWIDVITSVADAQGRILVAGEDGGNLFLARYKVTDGD